MLWTVWRSRDNHDLFFVSLRPCRHYLVPPRLVFLANFLDLLERVGWRGRPLAIHLRGLFVESHFRGDTASHAQNVFGRRH